MAATELQKAYAAGLIDGEGCIDVVVNKSAYNRGLTKNPQYVVRVTVHMTDLAPLEYLQSVFGGSVTKRSRTVMSYKPHWKDSYDWKISAKSALNFLKDIVPHLINKKEQALVALEFVPNIRGAELTKSTIADRLTIKNKLMALKMSQEIR